MARISPRPNYKMLHARSSKCSNEKISDFFFYSDNEMGDNRIDEKLEMRNSTSEHKSRRKCSNRQLWTLGINSVGFDGEEIAQK